MDYGIQLGRRFRSLKLWYVMRNYGREGIMNELRKSIQQAQLLKHLIESDADYEICAPVPLSLVCFRHRGSNEFNRQLMDQVNATGDRRPISHCFEWPFCHPLRLWQLSNHQSRRT